MRLGRNLLAGLANSIWTALVSLAVVPFYLEFLGIEAYGLIGFFATTQALLQLLDLGLAPTINREVARCSASGNLHEARNLLHTLAVIYWGMAVLIGLLVVAAAPFIAQYWLQSKQLPQETVAHAVMLMGVIVACRWPIGLYLGALMGAQRLTVSSGVSIAMVTLGNVGAVGVLAFVSPTIEAFFIWQAGVGLVYAATMRWAAWRVIGKTQSPRFEIGNLKRVWRFSVGIGAITLSGLVLTQLDKVILSKTLGLGGFGHYMLATVAASSLYVLVTPIFNVVYPRFSFLVAQEKNDDLLEQYRTSSRLLATMLFPIAIVAILLSEELIRLWTGNAVIAVDVAPLVSFLLLGYALHGVMHIPYALMLAHGETGLVYAIYFPLIIVMIPLTIMLSLNYGAVGGAIAQLSLFVSYTLLGTWITHKRFLKGWAGKWLLQDVGAPLGISVLLGLAGYFALQTLGQATYLKLLLGVIFWIVATMASVLSSHLLRPLFFRYWSHILLLLKKERYV